MIHKVFYFKIQPKFHNFTGSKFKSPVHVYCYWCCPVYNTASNWLNTVHVFLPSECLLFPGISGTNESTTNLGRTYRDHDMEDTVN